MARCSEDHIPSLPHGWPHDAGNPLGALDSKSVRRGFQVYKEVCASCHSISRISFRNLVEYGAWSEEEVKAIAAEYDIQDGPDDSGEMFERPGKLSDPIPGPYANDEAGRAANGGALPPDLSLMSKARHGGADYIFALLTGYKEAPPGKVLLPGLYYNPYFPGGAIAMPSPIIDDGQVEYPDGTPATKSQMAKDISTFLTWCAEPEHDVRKKSGFKWIIALSFAAICTGYYKRFRWSIFKTRQISYIEKAPPASPPTAT